MMVDVDHAIEVLNRIHETDPTVLPALIKYRVICNKGVAVDPTIQVGMVSGGQYCVGLLGILNGIFGVRENGWGHIAAAVNVEGDILNFFRTDKYEGE